MADLPKLERLLDLIAVLLNARFPLSLQEIFDELPPEAYHADRNFDSARMKFIRDKDGKAIVEWGARCLELPLDLVRKYDPMLLWAATRALTSGPFAWLHSSTTSPASRPSRRRRRW